MSYLDNKPCQNCNSNEWWAMDTKDDYVEVCAKCYKQVRHPKKNYLDNFECEKCHSNSGTLEDNDTNLTIVCSECGNKSIVLQKHNVQIDKRNQEPNVVIIVDKKPLFDRTVRCPKCLSSQIQATNRGFSLLTGFIGSNQTVNHCLRCGYSWKPKF